MNIWKLIPHHEEALRKGAFAEYARVGYLAIGWNDVGDLVDRNPRGPGEIEALIELEMPHLNNAPSGGKSLWKLYSKVQEGDYVIVAGDGQLGVMEVTGPYEFRSQACAVYEYQHVRRARLTTLDAKDLWKRCGGRFADGSGHYDTFGGLTASEAEKDRLLLEGAKSRYEATRIERNPEARAACIRFHGYSCAVCNDNLEGIFGAAGANYIHVHHLTPLSKREGEHQVDPERDLRPICPNCHSIAHRKSPPYSVEALMEFRRLAASRR